MGYDFKTILLGLRLQYYLPFVLVSGYILWYPKTETVQANQSASPLPIVQDSDPSTWPQPDVVPITQDNLSPANPTPSVPLPAQTLPPEPVLDDSVMPPAPLNIEVPSPPFFDIGGTDIEPPSIGQQVSPPAAFSSDFPSAPAATTQSPPILDSAIPEIDGANPPKDTEELTARKSDTPHLNSPSIISPYQSDEYRLTIGDTISVFIANIPEFTTENILRSDGSINLPVAGEIFLWDMTLEEAGQAITKHYVDAKVLQDPDVAVRLLASSPLKIAIAGEINRPGAYDVPVLDKKLPTVTDVIRLAGGIGGEADLRNVEVYRHNRQGGQELLKLNLFALFQEADLSQNITLRSGDRVIIPNAPVLPEEAGLISAANISPDAMQVGILGEVLSPGLIQAPTQTALNQALILAGGFNGRAKKTIQLVRTNEDGSVSREKIKIDWSASIGTEKNPILKHRDVVLVGQNAISRYTDFLDRAIAPLNRTIPFIGILDLLFPGSTSSGR